MRIGKKRLLQIWIVLVLVTIGLPLACLISLRNALSIYGLYGFCIYLGFIAFGLYWFYVRYYQRKKPRYPLAPPEGKADIYFPRTNIPRPIHEEFRRMQKKKRKQAKTEKIIRKRK